MKDISAFIYQKSLYTFIVSIYTSILLLSAIIKKPSWMPNFWLMYIISWLPFLLVNGSLTGLFTSEALVNYSSSEIIGLRIWTIPIEDSIYSLGMLLTVTWVYETFKSKSSRNKLIHAK